MLVPSDLVGFPLASPWIEHVKPYRTPRRRLRVAVPCTGVYGSKQAFSNLGSEAIACNIYDIEADYKDVLPTLLGDESDRPHLGPIAGDVMRVPLSSLTSCDLLVAGPPCPPWAGNGAKQSQNDLRCSIFDRILQWICYLSECGGLLGVLLENVVGITAAWNNKEPWMDACLHKLVTHLPDWSWEVRKLDATHYGLCQNRVRIILVGLRKIVSPNIPASISGWTRNIGACLKGILNPHLPNATRSDLRRQIRCNLTEWELRLKVLSKHGELHAHDLAVISVDRDPNKSFNSRVCYDSLPTLTCHNKYLFVLDVNELWVADCDKKGIFRFVHPLERFAAQGLDLDMALHIHPDIHVKATGNAYPPPLIAAVLAPLIDVVGQWADIMNWPPDELMLTKAAHGVRKAVAFKQVRPKAKSKRKKVKIHEKLKPA